MSHSIDAFIPDDTADLNPDNPLITNDENEQVCLNTLIQKLLKKHSKQKAGQLIVRCEQLPFLKGNESQFSHLCKNIIRLIVSNATMEKTQFLHISCRKADLEINTTEQLLTPKRYIVEFKTNIKSPIDADGSEKKLLDECEEILSLYNGTLQLFCKNGEGCLISLVLPGKLM